MIFIILFILLVSIGHTQPVAPKFSPIEHGCLIFSSLSDSSRSKVFGNNCDLRTPPCSVFKITLAEIGFKTEKLKSPLEIFKWDGIKRDRKALNQDQNLFRWMKDSVVWVSSIIADRIGRERIRTNLIDLKYGNATIGSNEFWIRGPLAISANEEAKYLGRKSPDLDRAIELLPTETVGNYSVSGKTGSCISRSQTSRQPVGWYAGRVRSQDKVYAFALRIVTNTNHLTTSSGGLRAKQLFTEWLQSQ